MAALPDTTPGGAGAVNPPAHPHPSRLVEIGREADALVIERAPWNARWWVLCDREDRDDPRYAKETSAVSDAEGAIDEKLDLLFDEAVQMPAASTAELLGKASLLRHELLLMETDRYRAETAHEASVVADCVADRTNCVLVPSLLRPSASNTNRPRS